MPEARFRNTLQCHARKKALFVDQCREKLRVAVVGAGSWGYQHARAFSSRSDTELVAVAGRTPERTKARADQFHVPYYLDIGEMLRAEKPDFVSVCLPAQGNFEATMQVIKAGFPLLSEKPIAYELDQARALIEAAQRQNLFYAIDFNQRYSIPCLKAKRAIEEGRLGRLVFALWRFGHGWGSPELSHPFVNIIEAQCHGFDMMEHMFGPITALSAEMTDNGGRKGFATFALSLSFKNGAVGSFLATLDANEHNRNSQYIELGGTDGRILIEDNVQSYTFQATNSDTAEVWRAGFFSDDLRCFGHNLDRHLDELIPAFRAGKQPPVPAERGLRALELAYAAIHSFREGVRVSV